MSRPIKKQVKKWQDLVERQAMNASTRRIRELRQRVIIHKLKVCPGFLAASITTLMACYNGVGPDAFPAWLRSLLTFMLASIEPVFLDHDYATAHCHNRAYLGFTKSNFRLFTNILRMTGQLYPWHIPHCRVFRIRAYAVAVIVLIATQFGGWSNWKQASKNQS